MMNDIDIKSLWKGQQAPVADLSAIHKKIKRFRLRRIGEAYAYICRKFGQEYADEIFIYNPRRILEDARQRRAGTKKSV